MSGKVVVAALGDLHIPSALGLFPDNLVTDDDQTVLPSRAQNFLRDAYGSYVYDVKRQARGGTLYTVLTGDIVESDSKDRSWQIVTKNPATIVMAASEVLDPLLSASDRVWFVRGTEAHAGRSDFLEEQLASDWGNTVKDGSNYSHWYVLARFGGVLFEFSHHTSGDYREWTTNGAAVRLAKETVIKYAERGEEIPRYVVRSHTHLYKDSYNASPICRAITTPGWTLIGAHGFRMGANGMLPYVGGLIFTIEGGRTDVQIKTYAPPRRIPWHEK